MNVGWDTLQDLALSMLISEASRDGQDVRLRVQEATLPETSTRLISSLVWIDMFNILLMFINNMISTYYQYVTRHLK